MNSGADPLVSQRTASNYSQEMSVRANYEGRYAVDVTGHSIRSGFTSSNLPIGMQLGGRPFSEETLLRVAHA